ncbi:LysR family transcriptional regulator [Pseudomonas sp. HR96]|uniref:LysR family transcriptional regulator n=1 Tax=Pseudomonas sp. HR96 TaxID=1027966 RepID=UPI002A747C0F|nr:LysR family transcriptional regulator [Pseudomonas sp. HR96]WPO97883.1 LysR family transcriptional regulator [Pseudomonas sp. HR96]
MPTARDPLHDLYQVNVNLLVVFAVLMQERNVTSSAARLAVSQPAVSNALRKLRQTFDDPLFVWVKPQMRPTPRARQLARSIMPALQELAASYPA